MIYNSLLFKIYSFYNELYPNKEDSDTFYI